MVKTVSNVNLNPNAKEFIPSPPNHEARRPKRPLPDSFIALQSPRMCRRSKRLTKQFEQWEPTVMDVDNSQQQSRTHTTSLLACESSSDGDDDL